MAVASAIIFDAVATAAFVTLCWHFSEKFRRARRRDAFLTPAVESQQPRAGRGKIPHLLEKTSQVIKSRWSTSAIFIGASIIVLRGNPLPILLIPLGMALTKRSISKRVERKRRSNLDEQTIDLLDSIGQSLKAGFSLTQALELSLEDVGDEMRQEIGPSVMAIRMGESPESALQNLCRRTASPSLRLLCNTLALLHSKGGDIPRITHILREKVAESQEMRRELETLTAQSRISGYLVSALPGIFLFIQASLNPRSVSPLFLTPIGNLIGVIGLAMNLLGFLSVRRILERSRD